MIRHKLSNKTKSGTVAEPKLFHQLNNPFKKKKLQSMQVLDAAVLHCTSTVVLVVVTRIEFSAVSATVSVTPTGLQHGSKWRVSTRVPNAIRITAPA
jgi:Na+/alanine symporter